MKSKSQRDNPKRDKKKNAALAYISLLSQIEQ